MASSKNLMRKEDSRSRTKKIYIFCEGDKTERIYFESFKKNLYSKKQASGRNTSVISIGGSKGRGDESCNSGYEMKEPIHTNKCVAAENIDFILKYAEHKRPRIYDDDCVICLMDCDAKNNDDIKEAFNKSKIENNKNFSIKLFLSNPSFELWYLLHYTPTTKKFDQVTLENELKKYLPDYKKNGDYYNELYEKRNMANKNAEMLEKHHHKNDVELFSVESNPSTMVPKCLTMLDQLLK